MSAPRNRNSVECISVVFIVCHIFYFQDVRVGIYVALAHKGNSFTGCVWLDGSRCHGNTDSSFPREYFSLSENSYCLLRLVFCLWLIFNLLSISFGLIVVVTLIRIRKIHSKTNSSIHWNDQFIQCIQLSIHSMINSFSSVHLCTKHLNSSIH